MDESPTFDTVVTFVVEQLLFGWPMPEVFDYEDDEEVQDTFWCMDDPTEWLSGHIWKLHKDIL